MATKHLKTLPRPKDLDKLIKDSDMWLVFTMGNKGIHFLTSEQEEAVALMTLYFAANPEQWEYLKEFIEKRIKVANQVSQN